MLTKSAQLTGIKAGPDDSLEEGEFIAYASVFGNIDSYGDVVMEGAFSDDLKMWKASENPIPLLFGHRMDDPDFNIGHLVDEEEDAKGLKVHGKLDLENPKAKQTYRLLKGRRLTQLSFAYDILEAGWEVRERKDGKKDAAGKPQTEEYFALKKLHVYEVSLVPIGANQETEILGVKALSQFAERAGVDLKAGRVISKANEEKLRTAHDAIGQVLSVLDESSEGKASGNAPGDSARSAGRKAGEPSEEEPTPSVDARASIDVLELELQLELPDLEVTE